MSPLDPASIERLAALTESTARRIADIGDDATRRASQAQWQGTSAERFRSSMADRQRECDGDAIALYNLAADLRRAAASYREELARLQGLERRIHSVMSGVGGELLHAVGITSASLPTSGSPAWGPLASKIASLGVRF
ncbi:hypothetical protein [Pseudofrankia inefficax]|uniref:Uncharacterized protein n=1 Tax=Pseudofrankia inefficax (strain DSM 45817 / CECT 9037 / DDB 130130 / EuI1c) TaxID=298654 RepID=E3IYY4_PSEI1|nr:hypothetical protein [Pseudofrankia inefficax]ADP80267.1 hypothetical protein FraEuI1c_2228 [Pseudofrankia inefficax]